ncbi:MAG: hypothetical protein PHX13_01105 [Thiovulaceae bacterium]|nr:hypothetical protein [Sulfurimonadaceae bacterium]
MSTSIAVSAYQSHDLSIMIKTSSGDLINIDLSNKQSLNMQSKKDQNGIAASLSFSSMQSFQFSVQTNGIDAQDKKEIASFIKQAQPYLDKYMKELDNQNVISPLNKVARTISDLFIPIKNSDQNTKNYTKSSIIDMFDQTLKNSNDTSRVFDQMKNLLDKTLKQFDKLTQALYA